MKRNKLMLLMHFNLLLCLYSGCMAQEKSAHNCEPWPEDKMPEKIGRRLVENYLDRGYWYMGKHGLAYPESCIAIGTLDYAVKTNDQELIQKIQHRYERFLTDEDPKIQPRHQHVDISVSGAMLLRIYRYTGDKRFLEKGLAEYADKEWSKTQEDGLTHLVRWWIDDMYMLTILQVEAYRATKRPVYADRTANLVSKYIEKLQQPTGMFHHADNVPVYWCRGNGWTAAGIAEALSIIPEGHPKRQVIMQGYKKMMRTLLEYQNNHGLWRQIIDNEKAWSETSGSAMFAYAMSVGVRQGWLSDPAYKEAVTKAWSGLCSHLDEKANLKEVCVGTNKKNDIQYYLDRPRKKGDLHGQAPMLWLANTLLNK